VERGVAMPWGLSLLDCVNFIESNAARSGLSLPSSGGAFWTCGGGALPLSASVQEEVKQ
jgi:hypothetical protein